MDNLQNIGQSYLLYTFLKRFKSSILEVQIYYPELIALSSDILISKITEKLSQLELLQEEPENIERNSISQIYFTFNKELINSQYMHHLVSCFHEFSHSQNHPINQLDHLQIPEKLKEKINDYLKKCEENDVNEKEMFSIYNSDDNIYQKNNHKINCPDDINQLFKSFEIQTIPTNFKASLQQLQYMINTKTIIQKILQMKPFFRKININLEENQIVNEYSDSEIDSESSASASGSESYLDPESDLKIGETSSEAERPSYSETDSSVETRNDQVIKLKIELDSAMNNLKTAISENSCLKSKIEKLLNEKVILNEQLQDIEDLRKEQIKAVEENAILKKENEKLKELKDDTSSSMASLLIVPSSDLNDILDQSSKEDVIVFNNYNSKDNNKITNSNEDYKKKQSEGDKSKIIISQNTVNSLKKNRV